MVYLKQLFATFIVLAVVLGLPMLGQGLKGAPVDVHFGDVREPEPLPGANDAARWSLFQKHERSLIGKNRQHVQRVFGKGAERHAPEALLYQLTKWKEPQRAGDIIYLELSIGFHGNVVTSYTIRAVR
jgi:hypothetical protein